MAGASGSKLKLYFDLMSQPSRAVVIFARANSIPFQEKHVALRKLEQFDDEYAKVNPFKKVPSMEEGDFTLTESGTIMRYLADKHLTKEKSFWYPKDDQQRAKVDEYLDWHHLNTRQCAMYFRQRFLMPVIKQRPVDTKQAEFFRKGCDKSMEDICSYFLGDRQFFLGDKISIADLQACCEIEQLLGIGIDLPNKHSTLTEWMQRVRKTTSPHYEEATKVLYQVAPKIRQMVRENNYDKDCSD